MKNQGGRGRGDKDWKKVRNDRDRKEQELGKKIGETLGEMILARLILQQEKDREEEEKKKNRGGPKKDDPKPEPGKGST